MMTLWRSGDEVVESSLADAKQKCDVVLSWDWAVPSGRVREHLMRGLVAVLLTGARRGSVVLKERG